MIKHKFLLASLVVALMLSSILISTGAHEIIHIIDINSWDDVSEVCIMGYLNNQEILSQHNQTPAGWVFYKENSLNDTIPLYETIPYIIQMIVFCACLLISIKIIMLWIKYTKGGSQ